MINASLDPSSQHEQGKLTARERIEFLLDEGSFQELDAPVETHASDGVVTGRGTISGRTIFVFARPAGSMLSPAQTQKITTLQDMALRECKPIVGLFDGDGSPGTQAEITRRSVLASGVVPQIAVIMGPCVGADAVTAALSDFVFMVRGTSHMFVAGPDVVKAAFNATITPDELGGAEVHAATSAVADQAYDNDVEALLQVRRLVDVLPASNQTPLPDWPAAAANGDDASLDTLLPAGPNAPYDIKELIAKVADDGDVFEIQAAHAANIVAAFGRVEGRPVGFVANQPSELAGVLDGAASRKAARFVRFCDCFNIPIVTFLDVPGFMPGVDEEHGGLLKHAAKLLYAYAEATVPKVTVITRKAAMGARQLDGDMTFAWGAAMGGRNASAVPSSDGNDNDESIVPRATRREVAGALAMLRGKALEGPWKKHGNIPL